MISAPDFMVFDTNEGAVRCMFGVLPGESAEGYRLRLRDLWRHHHAARQHLALYVRYTQRGQTRYIGPMAEVARDIVFKTGASLSKQARAAKAARDATQGVEKSTPAKTRAKARK